MRESGKWKRSMYDLRVEKTTRVCRHGPGYGGGEGIKRSSSSQTRAAIAAVKKAGRTGKARS